MVDMFQVDVEIGEAHAGECFRCKVSGEVYPVRRITDEPALADAWGDNCLPCIRGVVESAAWCVPDDTTRARLNLPVTPRASWGRLDG